MDPCRTTLARILVMALLVFAAIVPAWSPVGSTAAVALEGACGPNPCPTGPVSEGPCGPNPCPTAAPTEGPCGPNPCAASPTEGPCGVNPCAAQTSVADACGPTPCATTPPPSDGGSGGDQGEKSTDPPPPIQGAPGGAAVGGESPIGDPIPGESSDGGTAGSADAAGVAGTDLPESSAADGSDLAAGRNQAAGTIEVENAADSASPWPMIAVGLLAAAVVGTVLVRFRRRPDASTPTVL